MDDAIAQFTAITSADPSRAQQYLSLTDGNLEQAIQLYFDSGGVDMGAAVPPQTSQPSSAPARGYRENEDGTVTIDSDDEMDQDVTRPQPSAPPGGSAYEDDEAMARRLQEEAYGAGAAGQEEVRAPMARTTETLVGPDANWGGGEDDMRAAIAEQMMARQRRRKRRQWYRA